MKPHNCEESVTTPNAARKGPAVAFWLRPDIERARRLVDLWASCKHARKAGVDGCPTTDAIFERPAPTCEPWLDKRTGLWITDAEILVRSATFKPLPEPRLAELALDRLFDELGAPKLAVSLLFFLYPRTGPYEQEGDPAAFRPKALFGSLGGKYLDRARVALLGQLHREILLRVAQAGTSSENSTEVSEAA
ncbi:MAG TPA: hypothetical protein VKT78_14455 [Fimbriimonadaceae bacterium]|nr:hypothetical protein [Fimbriimonadaceae bacterium]